MFNDLRVTIQIHIVGVTNSSLMYVPQNHLSIHNDFIIHTGSYSFLLLAANEIDFAVN